MIDELDLDDDDLDDDPHLGWILWCGYEDDVRTDHLERFQAGGSTEGVSWPVLQMLTETLAQDESWGRYLLTWPALTQDEEDTVIQAAEDSWQSEVLTAPLLDTLTRRGLLRADDQLDVAAWPPSLARFAQRVKNRLR